jgi:hypothetical protein
MVPPMRLEEDSQAEITGFLRYLLPSHASLKTEAGKASKSFPFSAGGPVVTKCRPASQSSLWGYQLEPFHESSCIPTQHLV